MEASQLFEERQRGWGGERCGKEDHEEEVNIIEGFIGEGEIKAREEFEGFSDLNQNPTKKAEKEQEFSGYWRVLSPTRAQLPISVCLNLTSGDVNSVLISISQKNLA